MSISMSSRANRRDSSRPHDPYAERRSRFAAVLRPLPLWDVWSLLSKNMQEAFLRTKFPDPVLRFDESFPNDAAHRELRKKLDKAFRQSFIVVHDAKVSVRDFFSVLAGMKFTFASAKNQRGLPEEMTVFMKYVGEALDLWWEMHFQQTFLAWHAAVVVPLVAASKLDTRVYYTDVKNETVLGKKIQFSMVVYAAPAETKLVTLDGGARPMHRVGTGNEWHAAQWLSWDGEAFGGAPRDGGYLVYVQSHALHQLRDRLNLPKLTAFLEYWLYQSMKAQNIIERQGNELLVEFKVLDQRLGYLVVTPTKEVVVVRTFLFLTMEKTPEGRRLEKRLRLSRSAVNWLGLHELSAFTQTDLNTDEELMQILTDCGCGHLFDIDYNDFSGSPKALATEVRKFLRMAA